MKRLALLMAILTPLAGGCADIQKSLAPGETAIREAAWMEPEITPRPEALYCYRTIGRQDCYRAPQGEERRRLIEHYGPPPELLSY